MRAGLQQAMRILIAAGTVEVETRRSDASKFLHVNEKENNGCGIITQCNSVKEDWDMDVNKSLVLPSKNKECQKHTANTLQFWQHIFKELDKQLEQKEAEMKLVNNASVLKQHYEKKRNELEHEKLFMLDYHDLCLPYVSKVRKSEGATLYGSRSLSFLTSDGILKPPDIELTRPPINSKAQWKQVFTPDSDSSYWLKTHCVVEPIIIAMHRQLSSMHLIFRLLHPHLRYTMEINKALRNDLINRGMVVEDPNAQHGVKLIIEDYPLVNDGLQIWDAIKQWDPGKSIQWHKGNYYIFQTKSSLHFTQWDPGGRSYVRWMSQHGKLLIRIRTRGRVL
ncbi:linoleate 13S-lipoxygenase 2-1, chloroplastic-like [Medicago truncatula]|uniref:linoleate 13S-lipoxygenase 2-1, chloroplastic-like n=1 Tax=Medicago truncatula TaxID=3880 RepID=UPI001966D165|nr:linoleate 13S-lipoxygenase 2-1, chloroplastic-like [Medicago truncatula]